jgi:hypothetical protein
MAGIPHVEAIIGSSKLMNKQSLIPLPLTIVLDGSMHQHFVVPLFWMIKFSGVLQEHKEELMIVNGNGDDGASVIKGGAFLWKESWARLQFQSRGVIKNHDF